MTMKESCWKRGSKKDAEKIREAFRDLGACTCADYKQEDILYVLDGICGTLFMLPYESQTAEAIMDSHMFNELTLKVEPKFKVGDWLYHNTHGVYPILVKDYGKVLGYKVECIETTYYLQKGVIENEYHLWSIADAKDGDVLVSGIDNPFIYDGNIEFSSAGAYVGVSRNGRIRLDMFPSKAWTSIKDVKPATKEQRDLLFAKLREAGYEWDADKKELRKIIKPKFEVGDLVVLDDLLGRITQSKYEDGMWLYRVGCRNTWNFDYELMKADHRAENRILKGGGE